MLTPHAVLYSPFLAQLVVTRRCNLACGYCNEYDHVSDPVPLATLTTRLADLKRLGTMTVEFTGGEPMLNPDLFQAVQTATRMGFWRRMLISNATLLTNDAIRSLNDAGLTDLQVSLDGVHPNPVSHKVLRLRRGGLESLGRLARFRVTLSAVLGAAAAEEAIDCSRFARAHGFRPRVLLIHDDLGQHISNPEELESVAGALDALGIPDQGHYLRTLAAGGPAPFKCRAGSRYLYVNEYGSVVWWSPSAGLFAKPLASYTRTDLREQFRVRKPCTMRCTLGCARANSRFDQWRRQST